MSKRPLVSFLVPNVGSPTVGAAIKLADLLQGAFDTEIVGPDFGSGVCGIYRGAYPIQAIPAGRLYRWPDYWWERRRIGSAVRGDILVGVKAFASTVPIALREAGRRRVPSVVYLDEWDGALWEMKTAVQRVRYAVAHLHHPLDEMYHGVVERRIAEAADVWSTTTFLQRKFGGAVVHAGVDVEFFKPQPVGDVAAIKSALGLDGKSVIVFGGVVRPHKGVEEILDALATLADDSLRLLVVGPVTEHVRVLQENAAYARYLVIAGGEPGAGDALNAEIHGRMPLYLDIGDLVVLPLRDTLLAQSQMPIKVFEALAMGKPVIVTRVADLPAVAEGCGWVVPASRPDLLASAIRHAFDDEGERTRFGIAARRKAVERYSKAVCSAMLRTRVSSLIEAA